MIVGVPKEIKNHESRVALTPHGAMELVNLGHTVIAENNADTLIEIDGGVNADNAPKLMEAGADILVAGSFVFKSEDPKATIAGLKKIG